MTRVLDIEGHPWTEAGRQCFRLVADIDDLAAEDVLRLTDRATGQRSYWRVAASGEAHPLERQDDIWRGVLTQTDWKAR